MKVLIKSDVFDICNRIRKFDASYRVVYDNGSGRYQIYSTKLQGSIELVGWTPLSYVCTLPYNQLDVRAVKYLYDTSIENIDNILNLIDENNKKTEDDTNFKIKHQAIEMAENKLRQLS